jgi:hypothetical protein
MPGYIPLQWGICGTAMARLTASGPCSRGGPLAVSVFILNRFRYEMKDAQVNFIVDFALHGLAFVC